jgi:hypothetical protein
MDGALDGLSLSAAAMLLTMHYRPRTTATELAEVAGVAQPPDRHDEIWAAQAPLDFPQWVYGFDRSTPDLMIQITRRLSSLLGAHAADAVIEP